MRLVAERLAERQTVKDLREAIRRAPRNAEYHYLLGHLLESSLEEADWKASVGAYERAAQLNPHNAFYWLALAHAYEAAERTEDLRRAYEMAARTDPNQPLVAWQVGNFQLRQGSVEEALRQFHVVLSASQTDRQLIRAVFDLAWRGTQNNQMILKLAIPPDSRIAFEYLNFLLQKGRIEEALEVWNRVVQDRIPFSASAAFPLIDALIAARRVEEAQRTWKQLANLLEWYDLRFDDRNLITNGDFELEVLNGGFGWRFLPRENVELRFDLVVFHGGTRSLAIHFDGKDNVAYHHFFQLVPVQPNTPYRFRGWMKSEQITTDSGPRFEIVDYYAPESPLAAGEGTVGSSDWRENVLDFRTGPDTKIVRIAVTRTPSRKFDNKIQGGVWIDGLNLVPLQLPDQMTAPAQSER